MVDCLCLTKGDKEMWPIIHFLLNFEIRELSTHVMMVLRVKEKGIDLVSYDVNDKLLYKPQRLNHRSTQNLQLNKINT